MYQLWLQCSVMWCHTVLQIGTNILNKPATYNISHLNHNLNTQDYKNANFHTELLYSNWWYTGDMSTTTCNHHKKISANLVTSIPKYVEVYGWHTVGSYSTTLSKPECCTQTTITKKWRNYWMRIKHDDTYAEVFSKAPKALLQVLHFPQFEPQSGHQLFWDFLFLSSILPGKCQQSTKIRSQPLPNHFQFIIHQSPHQPTLWSLMLTSPQQNNMCNVP
jgi:hypothetical protein